MHRCSAESVAVVEDVGSDVRISTIDVVVPSGARVAVSEHDTPATPSITIATVPIAQPVGPIRVRITECIVPVSDDCPDGYRLAHRYSL
jgi:hypothetical protein